MYTDTFDEPTYKGLSYLFSSRTKSISMQGRRQRMLNAGAEGVLDQWQGEMGN